MLTRCLCTHPADFHSAGVVSRWVMCQFLPRENPVVCDDDPVDER